MSRQNMAIQQNVAEVWEGSPLWDVPNVVGEAVWVYVKAHLEVPHHVRKRRHVPAHSHVSTSFVDYLHLLVPSLLCTSAI
jgi:hypothetical protein